MFCSFLLVGCASPEFELRDYHYIPPDPELVENTATIQAWYERRKSVYALNIGDKRLMGGSTGLLPGGKLGLEPEVDITSGNQSITVRFQYGAFSSSTTLEFTASLNGRYQTRADCKISLFSDHYCDFWIQTIDTETRVTELKREPVFEDRSNIVVPIFL